MEFEIKLCLDDLFNHSYLLKDDGNVLKPCDRNPGGMYGLCKTHKGTTENDYLLPFHLQFCLQLLLVITTGQNFCTNILYLYDQ